MPIHGHPSFPSRRGLLAGALGGSFFATAVRAQATPHRILRPGDLAGTDGTASDLARARAGSRVLVQGYLAPSLDGHAFVLSDGSPMPCGLCGSIHDPGASLIVRADGPVVDVPEVVVVEGRLAIDGTERPTLAFAPADLRAA